MWPFRKKTVRPPAVGETWCLDRERDEIGPWNDVVKATVTDVHEGWVRYHYGTDVYHTSMPVKRFLSIYKRAE